MNVNNGLQGLQQIFQSPEVSKAEGVTPEAAPEGQTAAAVDQATLSPAASLAAQAPSDSDVRMDKVSQIQQALAGGNYNVSSSAVAGKMIDQMLGKS